MILLDISDIELKEYSQQLSYMTKDDIKAAKILLEAGEYKSANNRAYYFQYG